MILPPNVRVDDGVLDRLRTCVQILVEAKGNFCTRMDSATFSLVPLRARDFPDRLRARATKVLGVRSAVRQDYIGTTLFHFERLTPRERKALILDIIALYEGCLIDVGRNARMVRNVQISGQSWNGLGDF
jgi:hypothetical protein